jgi:gas vesicle protein
MADSDNFGAFLIGFVVGSVAGGVTALLLAPQSGEETRAMIKDRAIELRDQTVETYEATREKAEEAANEAVKRADALLKQAKATAAQLKSGETAVVVEEAPKKPAAKAPAK